MNKPPLQQSIENKFQISDHITNLFEGSQSSLRKTFEEATEGYMDKFVVHKPTSLFDPSKEDIIKALSEKKCVICGRRLYQNRKGDKWFCKSKTSNDKFMVLDLTLKKYDTK